MSSLLVVVEGKESRRRGKRRRTFQGSSPRLRLPDHVTLFWGLCWLSEGKLRGRRFVAAASLILGQETRQLPPSHLFEVTFSTFKHPTYQPLPIVFILLRPSFQSWPLHSVSATLCFVPPMSYLRTLCRKLELDAPARRCASISITTLHH